MQKYSSLVRGGLWVLAGALFLLPISFAEDGIPGDLQNPQRGVGGSLYLDDLVDLSAAGYASAADESDIFKGWSFGGFGQFSYGYNFDEPGETPSTVGNENVGRLFDGEHNSFSVNHIQLNAERKPPEGSWIGTQVKVMVGQDAKVIHSAGLNAAGGDDMDVIAANFSVHVPDDVKMFGGATVTVGKFETILGAEVISGIDNVMFSRSYLFGLAIPFTHTGFLYEQPLTELLALTGVLDELVLKYGLVNGWDNVEDNNDSKTHLVGITITPNSVFSLSVNGAFGNEQNAGAPTGEEGNLRSLLDVVAEINMPEGAPEILKGFSFIFNYDIGGEEKASAEDGQYAEWYGFSGIIKYDLTNTCNLKRPMYLAFRGESFNDPNGARIGDEDGVGDGRGTGTDFIGFTSTIGWKPFDNLFLRLEHRYDKAGEKRFTDGARGNNENYMNTVSADAIVIF